MYRPIDIILADDHEIFRDGFVQMIRKSHEIRLVGEAANGHELLELAHSRKPDVIITDIQMPLMDGIEATHRLTAELPHIGIIALSMYNDDYQIREMIEAGAKGYLVKNAHKTEIVAAIKSVYGDNSYFCKVTREKLEDHHGPGNKIAGLPVFSERETQIVDYICQEYSNKEIAELMGISKRTVEWHREEITKKMKVKNTAGIVRYAIEYKFFKIGVTTPPSANPYKYGKNVLFLFTPLRNQPNRKETSPGGC